MFKQEELVHEMDNLRRFALRLTRNASDSEDLVQATMLRALEKNSYFQENTSLFSWTSKIMFNLFVSQYRHKKKFETQHDPALYIDQAAEGPCQEACVDLATVTTSMKKLSREHRDILTLVCIQGLQYEEVSEVLRIPVGIVRSRLSRARKHLQDMLASPPANAASLSFSARTSGPLPSSASYRQPSA